MKYRKENNLIFLKLEQDEMVFEKLKELCEREHIESAIVLNGIGMLKEFKLGYFNGKDYVKKEVKEAQELVSMQGNIVKDESGEWVFHLHVSLGNVENEIIGGHFFNGKVNIANEITILVTNIKAKRKISESGLKMLEFE